MAQVMVATGLNTTIVKVNHIKNIKNETAIEFELNSSMHLTMSLRQFSSQQCFAACFNPPPTSKECIRTFPFAMNP